MAILRRRDQQFDYTTHSFYQPEKVQEHREFVQKEWTNSDAGVQCKKKKGLQEVRCSCTT